MEERKTKITPSKQDKKTTTSAASKLKTKDTIGKEKDKAESEVLTPRGGTAQSQKSDNLSTNSHPSPLVNKSAELSRPGAELQARFENKMENAAQKPENDNLDQSSNANTSSLQLSGQESNASGASTGQGNVSKPKKKEVAKGSPSQITKTAASSTVKMTKKSTLTLGERSSLRASTSGEIGKKEKTPRAVQEKSSKLKRDRNSEILNPNSIANISVNSSTESPPKASMNQENATNIENVENSLIENRDSVDNRKYSVEIEVNEEENESRSQERANITQFYKEKKGRINVWTYLFKNLYRAINELIAMCDIEQKVEFNQGVISTLETAIEDFQKMSHKFELNKVVSLKDKAKPLAWDISSNMNELTNQDELENCFDDLEDPDTVDFNLLTDLVREGKMTLNEAMVLIIRERAFLADEQGTNPLSNAADHKNSFISCGASDIFFDYKDAKEPKDDSAILPGVFHENSSSATARRARSVTPGRISLTRLANRITWKLANLYSNDEDDDHHIERLRNKSEQKQVKAELIRKDLETSRKEFFLREREKQAEVRERLEEKKMKVVEKHARKLDEAQERYEKRIQSIRKKAKNESAKVHEIAFITLLENQNKRLSLDEKLSDTRERRTKILDNIKKKQMERDLKGAEVNKRREQIKQESLQKMMKSKTKIEMAEERREKILEKRKKQFLEESSKILSASKRKKKLLEKLKNEKNNRTEQMDYPSRLQLTKKKFLKEKRKLTSRMRGRSESNQISPESKGKINEGTMEANKTEETSLSEDSEISEEVTSIKSLDELLHTDRISYQPHLILFEDPQESSQKLEQLTNTQEILPSKKAKRKKTRSKANQNKFEHGDGDELDTFYLVRSKSQPTKIDDNSSEEELEEMKVGGIMGDKGTQSIKNPDNTTPKGKELRGKTQKVLTELQLHSPERDKDSLPSGKARVSSTKGSRAAGKKEGGFPDEEKFVKDSNDLDTFEDDFSAGEESKRKDSIGNEELKDDFLGKRESVGEGKENESRVTIRWCSNCDLILEAGITNEDHIQGKHHRKIKTQYNLSNNDDQNCILMIKEEDAFSKLKTERLNTVRRRCKKIKQRMLTKALKHESACMMGKEASSSNKQRLQKLCSDLDKQVSPPQIKDYETLDATLKEVIKILDFKREADLHLMRQLKYIPIIIEICKRVTVCHKNEVNNLLRTLDYAIQIISKFTGLIDNRTYMVLTNRLVPLVDLLAWCLNRPTKFVYSLAFVPQLFNLLSLHLKHRLSIENAHYREDLIEYIFCCGLPPKLQQKFMSFNSGLDLSASMGKVPLALLKSVGFLEVLTNAISASYNFGQNVFEKKNVSENIILVLSETELMGMIFLLVSLLLSDGSYTKSSKPLPQTVLSLTMTSIKYFNNIARFDLALLQKTMGSKVIREQVFHVFSYLLTYCNENYDSSEDVKDLLNELLLLIGYFCVLNRENQDLLAQGTPTLVQKVTGLPVSYITDKKLRDILYPTLFCIAYENPRNLQIVFQEIALDHLEKYLVSQIQLFPLESIYEENPQHLLEVNNSNQLQEKKLNRPLSVSSNNSSTTSLVATKASNTNHFLFIFRFPRGIWNRLLEFIRS